MCAGRPPCYAYLLGGNNYIKQILTAPFQQIISWVHPNTHLASSTMWSAMNFVREGCQGSPRNWKWNHSDQMSNTQALTYVSSTRNGHFYILKNRLPLFWKNTPDLTMFNCLTLSMIGKVVLGFFATSSYLTIETWPGYSWASRAASCGVPFAEHDRWSLYKVQKRGPSWNFFLFEFS